MRVLRVAVTGASSCVFRHAGLEGRAVEQLPPRAAAAAVDAGDLNADLHATSAPCRASLIGVQSPARGGEDDIP